MSDVRAAADWYSLDNARELLEEAQGHYPPAFWRDHLNAAFHKGRQIAEHPPDELLPPTPEWVTERLEDWRIVADHDGFTVWSLAAGLIIGVDPDTTECILVNNLDSNESRIIHTRRQFLQLCEGLGVEVKVEKHHG